MKNSIIDTQSRVLVITSIIPTELIDKKKNENDILFTTEDAIKKQNKNIKFQYLFTIPKTGFLLSFLSRKWKSYYSLERKVFFFSRGRKVIVFPQIILPIRLAIRKLFYRLGLFFRRHYLDRVLKEFNPTVIHAQNADSNAFIARWIKKRYGIPYIVTLRECRNPDGLIMSNLKEAEVLIALTENGNIKEVSQQNFKHKIKVIPHGIPADSFISPNDLENKVKRDRFRIISVCRLLPFKNLEFVIRKLNEVRDVVDFEYKIYGEGPEYNSLEKLITLLNLSDRIFLEGRISHAEVKKVMEEADMFVLLSFPETFGRVFVESMATGLPFIARKDTGIYGMIENNVEGFFCDETNFLKVLVDCYNNPSLVKEVGKNARAAADRFKLENIANIIGGIYLNNQKRED